MTASRPAGPSTTGDCAPVPPSIPLTVGVSAVRASAGTLLAVGVGTVLCGLLAPWLRSGEVLRNSFDIVALLERFDVMHNPVIPVMVTIWPFLGLAMVLPVVLAAINQWTAAGLTAALLGMPVAGICALLVIWVDGREIGPVGLVAEGPITTGVGGALMTLAALVLVIGRRSRTLIGW